MTKNGRRYRSAGETPQRILSFVKWSEVANYSPPATVLWVVKRRAYIIGALIIGLLATTGSAVPSYCRVVTSALKVRQSFHDLKQAETMSPLERLVFSLVLAHSKTPKTAAGGSDQPLGRT